MEKISLFGAGFIGRWYVGMNPGEVSVEPRGTIWSTHPDVLYMISTVHNYHPKDGNPFVDIDTNLVTFMDILAMNKDKWGDALVFNLISTWFVYGNTDLPAKETSPCNPTGFYSITARAREQLLISYAELKGFKYRILRLGNVLGVGDKKISRKKNALQYIVSEVAKGNDVDYLYQNGAIRDFIDVRDCVRAIRLVLEKGETNQIYNIANGKGLNVNDLVYTAWQESGYMSKITEIPVPEFHRQVQTPKMYMDTKRLKALGYVQQHDIAQTVRELVHHYQHEKEQDS